MPVTRKFSMSSSPTQVAQQPPENDGPFSSLRKWLGAGTRVVSGVASGVASASPGVGTLVGAGLAGGGESLAEFIEGSEQNPYRIGAEAALGAVPFGRWLGAARGARGAVAAGRDFLAGGLASGVGEAGREWAEGEEMNPLAIGATTVGGGALGATIGAGVRHFTSPVDAPALPKIDPITKTNVKTKGGTVAVEHATPPTEGARRFSNQAEYEEFKRIQGFEPTGPTTLARTNDTVPTFRMQQASTKVRPAHRKVLGIEAKDIRQGDSDAQYDFAQDIRGNKAFDAIKDTLTSNAEHKAAALGREIEADRAANHARDLAIGGQHIDEMAEQAAQREWQEKLAALGPDVDEVTTLSKSQNFEIPGGKKTVTTKFKPAKVEGDDAGGAVDDTLEEFVDEATGEVTMRPRPSGGGGGNDPYAAIRQFIKPGAKNVQVYEQELPPPDSPPFQDLLAWLQTGKIDIKRALKNVKLGKKPPVRANGEAPPAAAPQAPQGWQRPPVGPMSKEAAKQAGAYSDADDELSRMLSDEGIPNDPVISDPIARLMNATVDNPGPKVAPNRDAYYGPFNTEGPNAGVTGGSWVDDALAALTPKAKPQAGGFWNPEDLDETVPWTEFALKDSLPDAKIAARGTGYPPELAKQDPQGVEMWQQALDALKKQSGKGGSKKGKGNAAGFIAPELAAGAAGGGGGALYGATQTEGPYPEGWQNRWRNAALYGGLGAAAGYGAGRLPQMSLDEIKESGTHLVKALPGWQRFAYLLSLPKMGGSTGMDVMPGEAQFNINPGGLIANAVVGPYGSAASAGLETSLASMIGKTGDKRGGKLLRSLTPQNFARTYMDSVPEALRRIREGEMGRADIEEVGDSTFQKMTAAPGTAMTTGDVAAGRLMDKAGYIDKEIREATLTSQPENRFISRLSDSAKGSTLGQFLFPFRRTPLNTVEQGFRRLPGVGILAQLGRGENMDSWNDIAAQQALGTAYGVGGYLVGDNVDPETAKWLRRYVTNGSGRYGLGAGLGFALGQAHNRNQGRQGNWADKSLPALFDPMTADTMLPLPSVELIMDYLKMGKQMVDSTPNNVKPPRSVAPPEAYDILFPPTEQVSRRVVRKF